MWPVLTAIRVFQLVVSARVLTSAGLYRRVLNGFIYGQTEGPTPRNKLAMADAFAASVWPNVVPALSVAWSPVGILIKELSDANDESEFQTMPGAGAAPGPRLPLVVTAFGRLRTGLRGQHFQGAKQFAPLPVSQVNGDELNASGVANWLSAAAALETTFGDAEGRIYRPAVVSRDLSQLETNPTVVIGAYVTSMRVNRTLSTWRHRREPYTHYLRMTGRGGVRLGGTARMSAPFFLMGKGGVLLGGNSTFFVSPAFTGSGGLLLGGTGY